MKTEQFETVITENSIKKCCEYSDDPEALKTLIADISVSIRFDGIKKHFQDDEEERLCGTFLIERHGRKIEFAFGFSITDTKDLTIDPRSGSWVTFDGKKQYLNGFSDTHRIINRQKKLKKEFMDGLLYSCLTSCKLEFYCPKSFSEFCSEFGLDTDSRKAKNLWHKCLEQSAKLERIFTQKESDCLPS